MATATSSSNIPSRPTYACIRCADRKVKCDRQRPCSACVKHNVDCVFNPPPPPGKRHKRVNRLRQYEALLREQGIDPSKLPETSESELEPCHRSSHTGVALPNNLNLQTPSSIESEPNQSINNTQVVYGQGRSKFVDNSLWSRVVEEFQDPEDALQDSSNDESDLEATDDDFNFVLSSQPKSNPKSRHPPHEHIHQLWQVFIENFDPLTKVVHVPTLQPAIQKAASNIETIPRSFEALMFAIYSAAILSLPDDECKQRFGELRETLLSRYTSATKAALSRAKFMGTMSLVVLQALVLHLLSVRDIYEPRVIWCLTGVAVRIAQGMGLERDGTTLNLPPFESEIRRRIWWLLKTHDFRTAELCGLAKFRDLGDTGPESTKFPANINDDQLYPGMPALPAESTALTDTAFINLRSELANFAAGRIARFRQQGKNASQWDLHASGSDRADIEEAFREVGEILETKYLRYCDPSQPLHLMTMLMARSSMNVVVFLTHHPRRWASIEQTPLYERQLVWETSIKLLEQHEMVQSNPLLKRFAWHAAYFLHWHTFIHVLDTLRANPLLADAEKAWRLIGSTYEKNQDMCFDTKKPIHVAVGNLCLKAYSAREAALQNGNICLPPVPEYILQLRLQREIIKSKKQARDAKSSQLEDPVNHSQVNTRDIGLISDASEIYSNGALESAHPQQNETPQQQVLLQTGGAAESDPFWSVNGFDDSHFGNLNDVMNMDPDFMLALDSSVVGDTTPAITWEQWDAWLADSNVIRPLSSTRDLRMGG